MTKTRHILHAYSSIAMLAFVMATVVNQPAAQEKSAVTDQKAPTPNSPVVHDLPPNVPGHTEFLDFKNGFRGVAFGTSIEEFKGLSPYRERNAIKAYKKVDEDLAIGTSTVQEIIYIFVHDKFFAVSIHADAQNTKNLLQVFQAAFGPGAHPDPNASQYFWVGRVASAHFYADMNTNHEGRGWIGNNELQKGYDQAMQEIVLAAAQQL